MFYNKIHIWLRIYLLLFNKSLSMNHAAGVFLYTHENLKTGDFLIYQGL